VAGAEDTEVLTGRYQRPSHALLKALSVAEPVLSPLRGGAFFELCLYLRRSRALLQEDSALVASLCPPLSPLRPDPPAPASPLELAGIQPRSSPGRESSANVATPLPPRGSPGADDAGDRSSGSAGTERSRQLSLFGS
jgi:hypothetical protein